MDNVLFTVVIIIGIVAARLQYNNKSIYVYILYKYRLYKRYIICIVTHARTPEFSNRVNRVRTTTYCNNAMTLAFYPIDSIRF
jgi:hypothetical protein